MQNFAKRLINFEAKRDKSIQTQFPDAFDDCEKLRPLLSTLAGEAGFRTLLSRALVLASAEVPWLRAVRVNPDGVLGGLEEIQPSPSSETTFEGRVTLLAHLLGLLVTFIGENLTLRLVQEAWPNTPLKELDLIKGVKNEKTK